MYCTSQLGLQLRKVHWTVSNYWWVDQHSVASPTFWREKLSSLSLLFLLQTNQVSPFTNSFAFVCVPDPLFSTSLVEGSGRGSTVWTLTVSWLTPHQAHNHNHNHNYTITITQSHNHNHNHISQISFLLTVLHLSSINCFQIEDTLRKLTVIGTITSVMGSFL